MPPDLPYHRGADDAARWPADKAQAWYHARPYPCGFNYLPRMAVNSTDMWQAETFDPDTVAEEMAWARAIGFNCCRVFLQFLVWEADPEGMLSRFDRFLAIADAHGVSALPILFDDCAFAGREPYLGPQDEPVPGVHNSGWTPSPGYARVNDPAAWPGLEAYVRSVVGHFADDRRVLAWDLYNEPANGNPPEKSLALVRAAFGWARAAGPSQPLTCGVWYEKLPELNAALCGLSDVLSFHDYSPLAQTKALVERLREHGRPLLCTEWMRRDNESLFHTHLPYLRAEDVGSFFWGLVNGRTQTHFPWGSPAGAPAPDIWFHDLLAPDGTPHRPEEVALIREEIRRARRGTPT